MNVSPYCYGEFRFADNDGSLYCPEKYGTDYQFGYCHPAGNDTQVLPYVTDRQLYCVCCPNWVSNTSVDTLGYRVLSVAYAPPGNASSVSYSAGSLTGSQTSVQKTWQVGGAVQFTSSVLSVSASWVSGPVDQTTTQVVLQTTAHRLPIAPVAAGSSPTGAEARSTAATAAQATRT